MVTASSAAHWSWVGAALALAVAVGCWPARPERHRLAAVLPTDEGGARSWARGLLHRSARVRTSAPLQLTATALLGLALAGPAGALAGSMLGGLWLHRRRVAARRRRTEAELTALVDALGVMTTELRAGAHPANAAADAATSGTAAVHRVLASVATGARLGADVPALLGRYATAEPDLPGELERLAGAWALAERHGVALAELLDAVRADLDARIRLTGQVTAQLAGPKASAAVLAGLPLLGIALGQGIGANPWHVLTATPVGQLLLVVGTALVCAGVTWSGRIMSKAVPE
ncbi:type II secretion system F family protein [Pseudonocardia acaciae]|uniref:type II secretion system F family protein n=1 Tax=Pseudonocardia acaciae TaxID=551276 RepID=UPI00068652A7|nr:type II secretion system F family protein [Pseudonocardia acaciae]